MRIVINNDYENICRISIHGGMTIGHIQEIRENILSRLKVCSILELDLSRVDEIDSSGFQLLFKINHEASAIKKTFKIIALSSNSKSTVRYNSLDFSKTGRIITASC